MPSHYMSKEEKEKMVLRIVFLYDKKGVKFKEIGIRMGISEAHANSIYIRTKRR